MRRSNGLVLAGIASSSSGRHVALVSRDALTARRGLSGRSTFSSRRKTPRGTTAATLCRRSSTRVNTADNCRRAHSQSGWQLDVQPHVLQDEQIRSGALAQRSATPTVQVPAERRPSRSVRSRRWRGYSRSTSSLYQVLPSGPRVEPSASPQLCSPTVCRVRNRLRTFYVPADTSTKRRRSRPTSKRGHRTFFWLSTDRRREGISGLDPQLILYLTRAATTPHRPAHAGVILRTTSRSPRVANSRGHP